MHISVLLHEVIEGLNLHENSNVVDATLGFGGHATLALQKTSPNGKLIAFERDLATLQGTKERMSQYAERCVFIHGSYAELSERVDEVRALGPIHAIMADLGLSSLQLDDPARGFAFRFADAPLDMRFDQSQGMTAANILASYKAQELRDLFFQYGDIPFARKLADTIVATRETHPLNSTTDLIMLVEGCVGQRRGSASLAQIFQALRIAVNRELEQLQAFLPVALDLLEPSGRMAIISFHSGEDRIVKQWITDMATDCICPPEFPECRCTHRARIRKITRKPIQPSEQEIISNPRSRSAKLRIIEKL